MNGPSLPIDLPKLHRSTNALIGDMLELKLLVPACERISMSFQLYSEFLEDCPRNPDVKTYFSLLAWK
jgi:hypothetical protein